jgi:putative ATPase
VEGGIAFGQTGFPDDMPERVYYEPVDAGLEGKIAEKLRHIRQQRQQHNNKETS